MNARYFSALQQLKVRWKIEFSGVRRISPLFELISATDSHKMDSLEDVVEESLQSFLNHLSRVVNKLSSSGLTGGS